VDLIEADEGWSPYLSFEDAYNLDDVRDALRRGDVEAASILGRIFKLTPVTESIPPEDKSLQSDPHWGPKPRLMAESLVVVLSRSSTRLLEG